MKILIRLSLIFAIILLFSILNGCGRREKYKTEIKLDKEKMLKVFMTYDDNKSLFEGQSCFIASYDILDKNCVSTVRLSCPSILEFELLKIVNYFFEFSVEKNKLTNTFIMDILDKKSVQHAIDNTIRNQTDENNYDEVKIEHYSTFTKYLQKRGIRHEGKTHFVEDNELTVFDTGNAHYVHKGIRPLDENAFKLCRKMYNESVLP